MLITENMLDEWARARGELAQGLIVETVWRLVAASSPKPKERRFPLGDSIGQRGRDGILQVDLGLEPYFPDGRSIWEVGTGVDPADKATRDYRSATRAVPEPERRDAAFIFVTPLSGRRGWDADSQSRWLRRRRRRGDWREVRIIDGTALVEWLHQFPSVEIWLAEATFGIHAPDIDVFESRWGVLKSYGEPPPLTPEVFLANRDLVRARLDAVLDGQTARLRLETLYLDQAADFVTAHLAGLDRDTQVDAGSRALFVSTPDAWRRLADLDTQHVLVTEAGLDLSGDDGTRLIQLAQRRGHSVIHSSLPGGIPDPTSAPLPSPRVEQIEDALKTAGHSDERARLLADRCSGNLASLKRLLQNLAALPDWSEGSEAADLAIAVVVGSWREASASDVETVEGISGNSYGAWIDRIRAMSFLRGAPLTQTDGVWRFGPRYEGWYALGPRIFQPDIDRIRHWTTVVLSEVDPELELDDEERPLASVRGIAMKHSEHLRRSLADSTALLGSHGGALRSLAPGVATGTAQSIVYGLFHGADWKRLASLDRLLPLLAEGSPEAFLDGIDEALRASPTPFDIMFERESSGMFGRTYMSGTIWALETLAWRPEYLGRVVLVLGELAARDPGGTWANRPANALTTILLPWHPQTLATIEQRLAAVDALSREEPEVAWALLLTLLPRQTQVTGGSRKPTWRAWIPDDWSGRVTLDQYREQASLYAARAFQLATDDPQKLVVLISHFESLSVDTRRQLLEYLDSDATRSWTESTRAETWTALTNLVNRHRMFADADWALDPATTDQVANVAVSLTPDRPDLRYMRLFTDRGIDLYEKKGDYAKQHELLESRRDTAVREIFGQFGLLGVENFASNVSTPWRVGLALGRIDAPEVDAAMLPSGLQSDIPAMRELTRGLISGRFVVAGWAWVDKLSLEGWSSSAITALFATLPFTPESWERVARSLDKPEDYWRVTPANPYGSKSDVSGAIDPLISVGRPFAALRCIHYILSTESRLLTSESIRALRAGLASNETRDQMSSFEVAEVFKALQASEEASFDDLIQLEWAYLPALDKDSGTTPSHLERALAESPEFFADVIRLVFKGTYDTDQEERNPNLAANGYRLLTDWATPPGLSPDGSFDGAKLTAWLAEVGELTRAAGRLEVAMTMVGHVLRHVPPDPGGLWIDKSAAQSLNARDAESLRDGFRTAELNSRGVHFVNPSGEDERAFADEYRLKAEALDREGLHRFAATLRELESTYHLEAEQVQRRDRER